MSAPLSAEEKAEYTRIIDNILSSADLETVTRKKVREGLEDAIGKDLEEQKVAIKSLIVDRFDAISGDSPAAPASPDADASVKLENGHKHSNVDATPDAESDANGEIEVSLIPAKKKQKRESSEDADAKLAATLQDQENRLARVRTTRGGANGKVTKKAKNKPVKKKSAKRARTDDSDEGSNPDAPKEKRKAGGGFQKPFNLSFPLAELCGEEQLSRPQVVKKLWAHIKANELQDPSDKRQIICDEKMHAIFKQNKVDMFQMNKLLGSQLYPIEE